jgi:hypothetical protein
MVGDATALPSNTAPITVQPATTNETPSLVR